MAILKLVTLSDLSAHSTQQAIIDFSMNNINIFFRFESLKKHKNKFLPKE